MTYLIPCYNPSVLIAPPPLFPRSRSRSSSSSSSSLFFRSFDSIQAARLGYVFNILIPI